MKRVLTIAGSDSSSGAGIQADIKTFAEFGVYSASVITSITSQSSHKISHIYNIPPQIIGSQIDMAFEDFQFDGVKIGMVGTVEAVNIIIEKIKKYNLKHIVLDTVFKSTTGINLISDEAIESLIINLFPEIFLITPNTFEAEILSGIKIKNIPNVEKAAKKIFNMGVKNILIKGGHLPDCSVDTLYDGDTFFYFSKEKLETNIHGTGCMFSAAITAGLANGENLRNAVKHAKDYVHKVINFSSTNERDEEKYNYNNIISKYPTNSLKMRKERIIELHKAIKSLKLLKIGHLIPEVQSNIAYATPSANSLNEIAAIPGRIIKIKEDIFTISPPEFNSSKHISKIVLTALKYNKKKLSAMNIKYSKEIIASCKKEKLKIGSFQRAEEPIENNEKEGTTLEWGTEYTIKRLGFVPDIIYDTGGMGKEPMIRIIAENPVKIVKIIEKIRDSEKNKSPKISS